MMNELKFWCMFDAAEVIFNNWMWTNFRTGVSNRSEVETGVQHIIADIIAKDKEVMDEIRKM